MPKMRVHELAKQLNKSSKEIIAVLKQQGIDVQSHMSTVTEENVAKVKSIIHAPANAPVKENAAPKEKPAAAEAPKAEKKTESRQEHREEHRAEHKSEAKPEEKSEGRTENKPENSAGAKTENKAESRPERRSERPRRDASAHGAQRAEGRSRDAHERREGRREGRRGEGRPERGEGRRNPGEGRERRGEARTEGGRENRRGPREGRREAGEGRPLRSRSGEGRSEERRGEGRPVRSRNGEGRPERGEGRRESGESRGFRSRNHEGRNEGGRGPRDGRREAGEGRGSQNRSGEGRGGENRRSQGGRPRAPMGGDTPINAKESRNGKENRHNINREHSKENNNKEDSRNGRNNRRGANGRGRGYNANILPKHPKNKKNQQSAPQPRKEEPKEEVIRNITLPNPVSLKDLADACKVTAATIIKKLFLAGQMVTINTEFSFDEAAEIALEYNCIAEEEVKVNVIEELLKEEEDDESTLVGRPPVVCVMGHVDHGKTSLLDKIRSTNVTMSEAGGITQHIGAYVVDINGQRITFLDTPGHEAFTSMRLRGAQATDIAVLVVAADDGVMPQTIEAINHAKAAEVEVIVAVNKIDKEGANVERVKQELTEYGLIAEDWGGSTVFVPVSAKTGEGIGDLLEMITLTAEVLELKANPNRLARGLVIEAKLDKGRGPVATILIQKGTLHVGDNISIGHAFGRIRAMIDDKGNRVKEAGPSTPVEILGLNDVPFSGEVMMAHENEKEARATADAFIAYGREKMLEETKGKLSLDDLFDQIQAGNVKELNLVVKADVQGSVEAVRQSLMKLSNDEVMIKVIHGGVGAINESDVTLASASNAIIIGFNVRPDAMAKSVAEREKVDMRLYRVIYNAIEDIEAAMKGMLDPIFEEKVIGHLDVRQIYKASGVGTIAGCYVTDGLVSKSAQVRIVRDGIVIYEGTLASLRRFKDDVKEVKSGFECGLVFEKYNDVKEGDQVEVFVMEEIPR